MREVLYECFECGLLLPALGHKISCDDCGGILQYHYPNLRPKKLSDLTERDLPGLWVFQKVLPLLKPASNMISLEEGRTNLYEDRTITKMVGREDVDFLIKDESTNPTGTIKDRSASVALSVYKERDVPNITLSSTGDTATSYGLYNQKVYKKLAIFVPMDRENDINFDDESDRTRIILVNGRYVDAESLSLKMAEETPYVLDGGFSNPNQIAGLETMAYETYFQLFEKYGKKARNLIDSGKVWYIHPTGSGKGLLAWYQAIERLKDYGFLKEYIHLVCVQPEGCASMVEPALKNQEKVTQRINSITWAKTIENEYPKQCYPYVKYVVKETQGIFHKVGEKKSKEIYDKSDDLFEIQIMSPTAIAIQAAIDLADKFDSDDVVIIGYTGVEREKRHYVFQRIGPISKDKTISQLLDENPQILY
ncbi:MAG: threonine synthase [Candidatus Jordarchaeum sp.]|uniref:threonine synthase n=1 Tax=Candidatus Jordarchaeum sp. TaxID=2823881 RepID=UPI00404B13D7